MNQAQDDENSDSDGEYLGAFIYKSSNTAKSSGVQDRKGKEEPAEISYKEEANILCNLSTSIADNNGKDDEATSMTSADYDDSSSSEANILLNLSASIDNAAAHKRNTATIDRQLAAASVTKNNDKEKCKDAKRGNNNQDDEANILLNLCSSIEDVAHKKCSAAIDTDNKGKSSRDVREMRQDMSTPSSDNDEDEANILLNLCSSIEDAAHKRTATCTANNNKVERTGARGAATSSATSTVASANDGANILANLNSSFEDSAAHKRTAIIAICNILGLPTKDNVESTDSRREAHQDNMSTPSSDNEDEANILANLSSSIEDFHKLLSNVGDESWLQRYNKLISFKSIYGHPNCDINPCMNNPSLGSWVERQRNLMRQYESQAADPSNRKGKGTLHGGCMIDKERYMALQRIGLTSCCSEADRHMASCSAVEGTKNLKTAIAHNAIAIAQNDKMLLNLSSSIEDAARNKCRMSSNENNDKEISSNSKKGTMCRDEEAGILLNLSSSIEDADRNKRVAATNIANNDSNANHDKEIRSNSSWISFVNSFATCAQSKKGTMCQDEEACILLNLSSSIEDATRNKRRTATTIANNDANGKRKDEGRMSSLSNNDEDDTNPNTLVDKEDSNICPPMKSGAKRLVIANDEGKQKGAKRMHLSTSPLHIEDGTNVVNMKSTHECFAIKLKDKRKFQEEDDNIGPSVKRPANASAAYEPPLVFTSLATAGQLVNNAAMLPNAVQALLPGGSVPEFLYQLTKMLTDTRNKSIIEWSTLHCHPHNSSADPNNNNNISGGGGGGRIEVHHPSHLEKEVLGKYFRHSKYSSFQRQLNYFGFRKIAGKSKMSPCSYVNDAATSDIRSLLLMKRKSKRDRTNKFQQIVNTVQNIQQEKQQPTKQVVQTEQDDKLLQQGKEILLQQLQMNMEAAKAAAKGQQEMNAQQQFLYSSMNGNMAHRGTHNLSSDQLSLAMQVLEEDQERKRQLLLALEVAEKEQERILIKAQQEQVELELLRRQMHLESMQVEQQTAELRRKLLQQESISAVTSEKEQERMLCQNVQHDKVGMCEKH